MRIGSVGYATRQGLGTLLKNAFDGGLVTDPAVLRHGSYTTHMEWYPEGTLELVSRPFNGPSVDAWLEPLDWVLFWETPFDWAFPDYCRARGKKTALVTMFEWFPRHPVHTFDRPIAPSLLDRDLIPGSIYLPIPLQERPWWPRTKARRFLHNGGHLGYHEHKGTRQILQAIRHVTKPLDLLIRVQPGAEGPFRRMCREERVPLPDGHNKFEFTSPFGMRVTIEVGEFAGPDLYPPDRDVFLMAEKYNGESLPLKEARASGMLVVTSDRYPMNTWLDRRYLILVKGYHTTRVGGPYLEFQEAEVDPVVVAATMDAIFDADVTDYSLSALPWVEENSWKNLLPKWIEVLS